MRNAESHHMPKKLDYDSRLVLERRTNVFYLCVPKPLEVQAEKQGPTEKRRVIALDPGVRTFMTGYDPRGEAFEFGRADIERIQRLCYFYDKLQSKWSQKGDGNVKHHRRWRMRKAGARIQAKIRHLVDDVHCRVVKFLVSRYSVILLPKFETSKMLLRRWNRRISSKAARAMATWSHFRFRQRLLNKVREYPWCRVVIVNEAYTSKTCGACGHIHWELRGQKEFRCPKCSLHCDRDLHAARNILLRFLSAVDDA
jgi:putative transposase